MAITAKEAQFYSEAKAKGFADEDIANEIRSRRSAAPAPAPTVPSEPSTWDKVKSAGEAIAKPFVDIGKSALSANDFATRALTSPRETFKDPGATVREGMRGVNSNIPFANTAVEAAGGPPAESQEDAKAAPGAQAFGGVVGNATVGPMLGGLAGKAAAGSVARSAVRPPGAVKEALKEGGAAMAKATERGAVGGIAGHVMGSPALGAAVGVASQVPKLARSAGVVADEGLAALSRSILGSRSATATASELAPMESAAAGESVASTPTISQPPTAPVSMNSKIVAMQDALATATPDQAEVIKKVIAGLEAKGAGSAVPRAVNPFDELTSSVNFSPARRAEFQSEMRAAHGGEISGVTDVPNGVQSATSEQATVARPRPTRTDWRELAKLSREDFKSEAEKGVTLEMHRGSAPGDRANSVQWWATNKDTANKYSRGTGNVQTETVTLKKPYVARSTDLINMGEESVKKIQDQGYDGIISVIKTVPIKSNPNPVDEIWAVKLSPKPRPSDEIVNTPGPDPRKYKADDENYARRLGMTVEKYREMIARRAARP